jgi:hypothetical protein
VGDVGDLVPGGVQSCHGGVDHYGLPGADVAGDYPEGGLHHAEADPGDRLGVCLTGEQAAAGMDLPDGAGQAEVRGPTAPGSPTFR